MDILLLCACALVFLFGATVGSFLNVLVARMNTSLSPFRGRSLCFSCGEVLSWRELIPVFSFLAQRGKCRFCKSKISSQYVIVELLTGIIFVLILWKVLNLAVPQAGFEFWILNFTDLLYFWTAASLLVTVAAYDLKHKIIPDGLVYIFAALALLRLILATVFPELFGFSPNLWDFLAGPILAAPLALLWLVSGGRWIGLGDAKLTLGIGWSLGLTSGLNALLLAFWIGAAVGVLLLLTGKVQKKFSLFRTRYTLKSEIPFAPFLILGFFLAFFGNPHFSLFPFSFL